ncbi:MAG: AAA family ATPase [Pseudomonadota bacterium]|nr:AAA family ATPase [Pseudomonadota bacterium]
MNDLHDLQLLLHSRFPIIVVETQEEARLLGLLDRVCGQEQWPLYQWSVADGLQGRGTANVDGPHAQDTRALPDALRYIEASLSIGVYVLCDAHPFLEDPAAQRRVKQIALAHAQRARTLVFVGHRVTLPPELQRMSARFDLPLPDGDQLKALLRDEIRAWEAEPRLDNKIRGEAEAVTMLLQHLVGLPLDDARRLIRKAIRDDGALTRADIARVLKRKHEALGQDGLLQLELGCESFSDVAGLAALKHWLDRRRGAFRGEHPQLDPPKGVLLLGVQGAGKSLACKAIAGSWHLPLLRMDFGALYSKWSGESERNLRDALRLAEQLAPCVLWLDEIEKGISTSADHADGGVSRRVLGTLLTWMSERGPRSGAPVFLAATANDVQRLPPELLRKGRFDEIFFVDLPSPEVRSEIFRIHLQRRGHAPEQFDLASLAAAAHGFSGAEIEQAIVGAMYEAAGSGAALDTALVLDELRRTRPLSVVMAEPIEALRAWARERTVPAD